MRMTANPYGTQPTYGVWVWVQVQALTCTCRSGPAFTCTSLHYVKINPHLCVRHPHALLKKDHIDESFVPCIIPSYGPYSSLFALGHAQQTHSDPRTLQLSPCLSELCIVLFQNLHLWQFSCCCQYWMLDHLHPQHQWFWTKHLHCILTMHASLESEVTWILLALVLSIRPFLTPMANQSHSTFMLFISMIFPCAFFCLNRSWPNLIRHMARSIILGCPLA